MDIRTGEKKDTEQLWELAKQAHRETRYSRFPMDRNFVEFQYTYGVEHPYEQTTIVAEVEGKIVGFIMAFVRSFWFGPARAAHDLMLYVHPDFRNSSAAPRLVDAYVKWAKHVGAEDIWLGTTTGIREYDVGRFFERQGFTRLGGVYVFNQDVRKFDPGPAQSA